MLVKNLKANEKNPRKISKSKREALKRTMHKFGDLGAIVFNKKSERLVAGHQRVSQIDGDSKITYTQRYKEPTKHGTVAEGYITVDGENFKYREVSWDAKTETEAMLAANKSGGDWDQDLLKVALNELAFDISNTGFELNDLRVMNIDIPKIDVESIKRIETPFQKEESDEQYVRNTPQTTEQISTERPSNAVFESVEEKKMDVTGRRYVIIIDCQSQDHKDALKNKIQPLVKEAGGKFF